MVDRVSCDAEKGRRERRCDVARRRGNARGTARGAVGSRAATRCRGGEGRRRRDIVRCDAIWRGDEEMHEARRATRSTHRLQRGAERGRADAEEGRGVSGDVIVRHPSQFRVG
jgi:hypothetical protein